jgi:hypothetical protein
MVLLASWCGLAELGSCRGWYHLELHPVSLQETVRCPSSPASPVGWQSQGSQETTNLPGPHSWPMMPSDCAPRRCCWLLPRPPLGAWSGHGRVDALRLSQRLRLRSSGTCRSAASPSPAVAPSVPASTLASAKPNVDSGRERPRHPVAPVASLLSHWKAATIAPT